MKSITPTILEEYPFYVACNLSTECNIEMHIHTVYELFMATTDNIRYYIEGQTYNLMSGDLIITNTSEIHRPMTTNCDPYGRKFILFNPDFFTPYFENFYPIFSIFTQRKKGYSNHLQPTLNDRIEIEALFDKLLLSSLEKDAKSKLLTVVTALELFIKVDTVYNYCYPRNQVNQTNNLTDPRVQAILNNLNENFEKPITLDQLADEHYIDKYYMCRLFKKETGFSIIEYLQSRRILYAKSLINEGFLTLNEVSQKSGFNDYSNFYKTFIKIMQVSPRYYQQKFTHHP